MPTLDNSDQTRSPVPDGSERSWSRLVIETAGVITAISLAAAAVDKLL